MASLYSRDAAMERNLSVNDKLAMLEQHYIQIGTSYSGSSIRKSSSAFQKRVQSPTRKAQKAVQQAREYEEKMVSRVNYL